jgi:hypothetical protein
MQKLTPYQINANISTAIRYAKGISFNEVKIDDYGQIRHYYRCGLDPKKLVTDVDSNGNITVYKEQEQNSSDFMDTSMQLMLLQRQKDDPDAPICIDYPTTLWLEEYKASMEKDGISAKQCTEISDIFKDYFSSHNNDVPTVEEANDEDEKGMHIEKERKKVVKTKDLFSSILDKQQIKLRPDPIIDSDNAQKILNEIKKNEDRIEQMPGVMSNYETTREENKRKMKLELLAKSKSSKVDDFGIEIDLPLINPIADVSKTTEPIDDSSSRLLPENKEEDEEEDEEDGDEDSSELSYTSRMMRAERRMNVDYIDKEDNNKRSPKKRNIEEENEQRLTKKPKLQKNTFR